MDNLISRQSVKEWLERWEGYLDKDMIARMQLKVDDIPTHETPSNTLDALDCVERQAAIDAIYAEFEYVYCFNCDHEGNEEWCEDCHRKYMKWSASRNTIERVLNGLPSVQPRKGKWTRHFDGNEWYWYCSSCKEQWYEEDLWMGGNSFPNFCPNCGCRMEEGDSNDSN